MSKTLNNSSQFECFARPVTLAAAALGVCFLVLASTDTRAAESVASSAPTTTGAKLTQAIESPLRDVNLMRTKIPSVLQRAQVAPYASVGVADCATLRNEIDLLDIALGPDLDATSDPHASRKQKLIGKAIGAGADVASSVIPYRGVVRFVSGTEKHDELTAQSVLAGSVRRAYLKGVGENLGCSYPGAPFRTLSGD